MARADIGRGHRQESLKIRAALTAHWSKEHSDATGPREMEPLPLPAQEPRGKGRGRGAERLALTASPRVLGRVRIAGCGALAAARPPASSHRPDTGSVRRDRTAWQLVRRLQSQPL